MLRTLSIALLLTTAAAGAASAQSSERFAVGVVGGTTGAGLEAQFQASPLINLRVAGDFFSYEEEFSTDDIDYDAEIDFNQLGGFVDLHPFNNSFFVSGGLYAGDRMVEVNATTTSSAQIGDVIFTPAQIGTLTGSVDFGDTAPFLGLGFNNTFRTGGRIGFKAVVGAAFGGDPEVQLRRSGGITLPNDIQTLFDAELRKEEAELQEEVEDFKTFPVIQVGLTYRF